MRSLIRGRVISSRGPVGAEGDLAKNVVDEDGAISFDSGRGEGAVDAEGGVTH